MDLSRRVGAVTGFFMTVLKELRLRHFRAFGNALLPLSDLTILVGRNGAGKSTLMDALEFIRDAVTESLTFAVESREGIYGFRERQTSGAPYDVSMAVRFSIAQQPVLYGFKLGSDKEGEFFVKEEVLAVAHGTPGFERGQRSFRAHGMEASPVIERQSLLLPVLAGQVPLWREVLSALRQTRAYRLSPSRIREEPKIGSTTWLDKEGSNAGDVLKHVERNPDDVKWIVRYLREISPGISSVHSDSGGSLRYIIFKQGEDGKKSREFFSTEMSDGTLRVLGVLLAVKQDPRPVLASIDEVEDSLHPYALSVLMDAMVASIRQDGSQIVISTHSPEVLSHPEVTPERVRIIEWRAGQSFVYRVAPSVAKAVTPPETIGRLLRANALWPDDTPCTAPENFWSLA